MTNQCLRWRVAEWLMPKAHGGCQRVNTENFEFSIEHRIYSLARKFHSGHTHELSTRIQLVHKQWN